MCSAVEKTAYISVKASGLKKLILKTRHLHFCREAEINAVFTKHFLSC